MQFESNQYYHVYNQGNNRTRIFFNRGNYLLFLRKMRKFILPLADVIAYCLMPNHFHLLLRVKEAEIPTQPNRPHSLSRKIGTLLSSYTQAVNVQQNRTGSLFRSKTKAKNLLNDDENYPLICFHYIHQNPLKAGLVKRMRAWEFSSYRDYAGLRVGSLVAKKMTFRAFSLTDERHFIALSRQFVDPSLLENIK